MAKKAVCSYFGPPCILQYMYMSVLLVLGQLGVNSSVHVYSICALIFVIIFIICNTVCTYFFVYESNVGVIGHYIVNSLCPRFFVTCSENTLT